MTETPAPYVTTPSPLEQAVAEMQAQLHWASMIIIALLELEGLRECPNCGYRLKEERDPEIPK